MGFLDDYEPVENRIRAFWEEHPEGRITTELVAHNDGDYIFRAEVFKLPPVTGASMTGGVQLPDATGYAHDSAAQLPANMKASALEVCETSAIGRALANAGYAPKGKRPSREEMAKSERPEPAVDGEDTAGSGERAGEGGTSDGTPPPPSHDHEWIQSPKLEKYLICSVDGCLKTKRKPSVHTAPVDETEQRKDTA